MASHKPWTGLLIGLTTLDLIYRVDSPPAANQKIAATKAIVAAGGPATNAAIAFQHQGGQAILLSSVGVHAIAPLIRADLQQWGIHAIDLTPQRTEAPPISSILITEATGDRAVISSHVLLPPVTLESLAEGWLESLLDGVDVVLCDGHQLELAVAIAQKARQRQIPTVLDGGSWKPGLDRLLPWIDYAICSANFRTPKSQTEEEVVLDLMELGVRAIAITHGDQPIHYCHCVNTQWIKGWVEVAAIQPVDTLGAGDVFHGAFCAAILQQDFVEALAIAARVATHSCQFFGTREWMADAIG